MSERVGTRSARWARVVHVGTLIVLIAAFTAVMIGGAVSGAGVEEPALLVLVAAVVTGFSTLGRLIVVRADNALGWIFLVMGLAVALGLTSEAYLYASFPEPFVVSLPGTQVAGVMANFFPFLLALLLPVLFLLFPTGAPPSRPWRRVMWLWAVGVVLTSIWVVFRPEAVYSERRLFSIANPLGMEWLRPLQPLLLTVGTVLLLMAVLLSIASLVVRFRRASAEERQQIKWLLLVALAAAILFLTLMLSPFLFPGWGGDPLWIAFVLLLLFGIPTATALAIFRYRLYDVDVVVSKTIAYAGLGLGMAVVYGAVVVGLGELIEGADDRALRLGAAILVAVGVQPAWSVFNRLANRIVYGGRSTPYQVMAEFGERLSQIPSVDQLLPDMAEAAARGVGARAARVRMFLPGPDRGPDRIRSATWPSDGDVGEPDLTLPIEHAGEPVGDLSVAKAPGDPLRATERTLLEDLASHAGIGLENARLSVDLEHRADELSEQTEELRRSRERLVTVRDAQRRRLEQELRDGVGAEIAAIRDEIHDDAERVVVDPDGVRASLEELSGRATVALNDLREVARGIFPPLLSDEGLAAALGALARRAGPDTQLSIVGGPTDVRYAAAVEAAIYFCCVQALQNAERHAPGRRVDITLAHGPGEVSFSVHDRGIGFDVAHASSGEGLQIMRDRIAALGGTLAIESTPGTGTTVTGSLPARALAVTT